MRKGMQSLLLYTYDGATRETSAYIEKDVLQKHMNDWERSLARYPDRNLYHPLPVQPLIDLCAKYWAAGHLIDRFMYADGPLAIVATGLQSPELSWLMVELEELKVTVTLVVTVTE